MVESTRAYHKLFKINSLAGLVGLLISLVVDQKVGILGRTIFSIGCGDPPRYYPHKTPTKCYRLTAWWSADRSV